jgi:purine-binding chemotaxis protein CheW
VSSIKSSTRISEHSRVHGHEIIDENSANSKEFLTMRIAGQLFGIPVLKVQDALSSQSVTPIPLAPKEISGSLNLRGRIVTAIDIRTRLGYESDGSDHESMSIVVEHGEDLYSLIVDKVGDVLMLPNKNYEKNPATLEPLWREISGGIYRLDGELLVVLDVARLLKSVYPAIDKNEVE